jgi:hypothetical protein
MRNWLVQPAVNVWEDLREDHISPWAEEKTSEAFGQACEWGKKFDVS